MAPMSSNQRSEPSEGARNLQEKLHQLLSRLSATIEVVKTWPESDGDDPSIHVTTTTRLISSVVEVVEALKRAEGVVKADQNLRQALQDCPVPLDLLVLLDHGNGLNPDCFSRGLLKEALGQLAGLKRRKLALSMLGAAVQAGLNKRIADASSQEKSSAEASNNVKREREESEGEMDDLGGGDAEREAKRVKTES